MKSKVYIETSVVSYYAGRGSRDAGAEEETASEDIQEINAGT